MKNIFTLLTIIVMFSFLNCKKNKTQPTDLENITIETTVVQEDIDTISSMDSLQIKENEIKENIISEVVTKPTEKKVEKVTEKFNKPATKIIEEETVIKEIAEEKVEETVEKVVEEVVEEVVKEAKTTKEVIKKEVDTVTEPVIEKVKKEVVEEPNTWVVPAKYVRMTNPEDASKENLSIGKNLYSKHCKSCHGKEGYGDGPKAEEVEGDLGDFSSNKFKEQSDGALFYKSYIGRDDMPNYEKKMSEEDAWLVVHYIRTL